MSPLRGLGVPLRFTPGSTMAALRAWYGKSQMRTAALSPHLGVFAHFSAIRQRVTFLDYLQKNIDRSAAKWFK